MLKPQIPGFFGRFPAPAGKGPKNPGICGFIMNCAAKTVPKNWSYLATLASIQPQIPGFFGHFPGGGGMTKESRDLWLRHKLHSRNSPQYDQVISSSTQRPVFTEK